MQALMRTALLVLALVAWGTEPVLTQAYPPPASSPPPASNPPSQGGQYSSNEVVDAGHRFFGTVSRGLAEIVEKAGSQWGLPNGYVLGQEAGGAWVAGLRYGEGILYIPLRLENPKIGGIDDAEIVGDRIAEDRPVFRYLLAQEM